MKAFASLFLVAILGGLAIPVAAFIVSSEARRFLKMKTKHLIARALLIVGIPSVFGDGVWDDGPGFAAFAAKRLVWNVAGLKRMDYGVHVPPGNPNYLFNSAMHISNCKIEGDVGGGIKW